MKGKKHFIALKTVALSLLITSLFILPVHAEKTAKKWTGKENAGTIKIGIIGPATGELAEYGQKTLLGASLAVNEINERGGVLGRKLEVIPYDDKNTRSGALNAAAALIEKHKVIGIIAAPTGWSSFGPTFAANDSKTIYISAGTRRKLGRSGTFIFRNSLPDNIAAEDTIAYCSKKLGYKNYAIITSVENDFSLQLTAYFKKAILDNSGTIITEAHTGIGYSNIKDAISEIKQKSKGKIDAIVYTGNSKEGAGIMQEVKRQGLSLSLIGGEDLMSPELWKAGSEAVLGTIAYASFAQESKSDKTAGFVKLYKNENGKYPDARVALAYDAAILLAEAIKSANSTDKTKVRDALANIKGFRGATGSMSFGQGGEPLKHPYIFKLEKLNNNYAFKLVEEKK